MSQSSQVALLPEVERRAVDRVMTQRVFADGEALISHEASDRSVFLLIEGAARVVIYADDGKLIEFHDGGYYRFPKSRWSFSNYADFFSTNVISRGPTSTPLPRAERDDLDDVTFKPLGGSAAMTWKQSLSANYTDAILVLHKGKIVYERYFGVTTPQSQHIVFSITKSFVGTIAAGLVAEGKLDREAKVATILPELAQSGFADATVGQVMDMTTALDFDETYANAESGIARHAYAGGIAPRRPGYDGPEGFRAFLATVKKSGEHGEAFAYRTVNSDALAWIVERVIGEKLAALIEQRIWQPLGMEAEGLIQLDKTGTAFAGGGLMLTLRDLARFGEYVRTKRPELGKGGDPAAFAKAGIPTLPGWSYANQWWISNNAHGAFTARGVHGQALYIDPKAEMVIARFGSHPVAGNVANDPTSLPAFHAAALHLLDQ